MWNRLQRYIEETGFFPFVTGSILVVNVLIFVVQELCLPDEWYNWLFSEAVLYWPAVTEGGQYYRLVTAMFLHFNSTHLVNNMLILYMIGSRLEELLGKGRFVVVYFVAGILAGLTSMEYNILQNRLAISAGASGAVFGIIGGLLWVVVRNRGRVQGLTGRQMLLFVLLSLYGGYANQQTDNVAHLGGLAAGLLLTLLLYRRKRNGTEMEKT